MFLIKIIFVIILSQIIVACNSGKTEEEMEELWSKAQTTGKIIERSGTKFNSGLNKDLALLDAETRLQTGGGLLGNLNNLQILDTAKDNWTEMLLQRVKNGLSGGKDQLDFQLNPRNLGKMRISLFMQNDRTNIHIQTETSAAASMLSDSESRLAQMLEASGLRLGNLNSGQFQGFGGTGSDQQANYQSQSKTSVVNQPDDAQGEVVEELVKEGSDNLINIQA